MGAPSALTRTLELPDGTTTTTAERILTLVEGGVPLTHAAGAAGVTATTLKDWLAIGGRVAVDLASRRRTRVSLTPHEQACFDFSARTAERREGWIANALLGVNEAREGGRVLTKTVTKTTADGAVETSVTVEELAPNVTAATWMLSHALPAEFGRQRLEVTGPDGGPLTVDLSPADVAADMRAFLEERRRQREDAAQ